jgi:3-dehydroquinate synthase
MKPYSPLLVDLGDRSYSIFISSGILSDQNCLIPFLDSPQVCIVTNETVGPLYVQQLKRILEASVPGLDLTTVTLPDGEAFKNLATLNLIYDRLLEHRHSRKTTIIALGGGVVGDMAGFCAATYQRGVNFIQVPTTLLSQVDSSVGGKTGVNHEKGKNMIGAFYQPRAVLIDIDVLQTLPDREVSAGLAEVIKYGLIYDAEFFAWLEQNINLLRARDPSALNYAIRRSCEIKAEIVAMDEHEGGIRAILNFGHTYGHAIETEMGYGVYLHGEAVAIGMAMACELSVRLGRIDPTVSARALKLIAASGLPTTPPPAMTKAAFLKHMAVDKKVIDGRIRLVLLSACGQAEATSDFDRKQLEMQLDN